MHKNGTTDVFIRHEELGHGGFAYVYRATLKYTNKTYAIKVISKEFADIKGKLTLKNLKNEMSIEERLIEIDFYEEISGSFIDFEFSKYIDDISEYLSSNDLNLMKKT